MPDLAPEEREKRMREISRAAEMLLKGVLENDAKGNGTAIYS